jgi:quercetin dioxygenase-like cupin family protein
MSTTGFEEFAAASREAGFDEVTERRWDAGVEIATHTHPFAVQALVVQGDMVLICRGQDLALKTGDRFELAFEEPHAERYGAQGATFWAARRHSPG